MMLPLAIFAGIGAAFYWGLFNNDDRLPSALIGRPMPEFTLPPIEGREDGLASTDLTGQVSLVNVWASWCVPCRAENPLMVELAETGEVPIYGINYKDAAAEARAFLDELGNPFTRIGADRDGRVAIDWGVYGVPETYVIDAAGRIAFKHVGPFNRQILNEEILPLVRRLQEETVQ
ncbi:DsbE family thiol:disulfide interchange protein [Seohaeicola nanhaiensis]|uniref:DsbE family thiol:disulfide interchange protein n=1 Tax=Seohaeicola nanhaiensis TaxID=1387282 RepID=A0ABV9KKZ8_9RHOB